MGSLENRLVLPLVIFACGFAGMWGLVASARAEEGTTTKEENPPAGEAVAEPIHQPVKEAVEAIVAPQGGTTVTTEPTTSPTTTTTSEAPVAATGGSSGAASPTPATTPKPSTGSSSTSRSTNHDGNGGDVGGGVHHAGDLTGGTGSQGGTDNSSPGGEGQAEFYVPATSAVPGSEGVGVTATEAAEPAPQAGSPTVNATKAHVGAAPRSTVKLDGARAVETAPPAKPQPKASSSPLATVGRVLSHPFSGGSSVPAVPFLLIILLSAALIGWFFWYDRESPSAGGEDVP